MHHKLTPPLLGFGVLSAMGLVLLIVSLLNGGVERAESAAAFGDGQRSVSAGELVYSDTLSGPVAIPDAESGITDTITIADTDTILDLELGVVISHTWMGDLVVLLTHVDTGTTTTLIHRPGVPAEEFGCPRNNIAALLDDEAPTYAEDQCAMTTPTINGTFRPNEPLDRFDGESLAGTWQLTVCDVSEDDVGALNAWAIVASAADKGTPTAVPVATATPPPASCPAIVPTATPGGPTATATPTSTPGGPTVTPTPTSNGIDTDLDGCTDDSETGPNETLGGRRDPNVFWDFFDSPNASNVRDKIISIGDIFQVVGRFGTNGDTGIDPLSAPPASGYHTAYDRSAPDPGGEPWDLNAPDGSIATGDILFTVNQFGHSCA